MNTLHTAVRRLGNTGETIVEVLLTIAIVGSVVTGAYAVASRSLAAARQAQERGEALKIAEGQVEQLKLLAGQNFAKVANTVQRYCIYTNAGALDTRILPGIPPANYTSDPLSSYGQCNASNNYYYFTEYVATSPSGTDVFTTHVRWGTIGSGRLQEVTLVYRIHQ